MLALSQRRLAQGADLDQCRSSETSGFVTVVIEYFALAMKTIAHPGADVVTRILNAKVEIEAQADSARQRIMSDLKLRSQEDALNFRLANDMIEHLNEVARLSRAIARASQSLNDVQVAEP